MDTRVKKAQLIGDDVRNKANLAMRMREVLKVHFSMEKSYLPSTKKLRIIGLDDSIGESEIRAVISDNGCRFYRSKNRFTHKGGFIYGLGEMPFVLCNKNL